jgi:hypothetical protein
MKKTHQVTLNWLDLSEDREYCRKLLSALKDNFGFVDFTVDEKTTGEMQVYQIVDDVEHDPIDEIQTFINNFSY